MPSSPVRSSSAVLVIDPPRMRRDLEPLLRGRLLILAILAALTTAFFFLFRTRSAAQWDYFTASSTGVALLVFEAAFFVAALAIAAWLWRQRTWGLRLLRVVEFVMVGLFAIYIAWSQLFAWAGARFLATGAVAVDPFMLRQAVDSMAVRWLALIVGLAALVPETWRRSAALTGGLAVTAMVIMTIMVRRDPVYAAHAGGMVSLMGFWMTIAVTIAVFGAYKLAELREQVQQARQLGPYRLIRRIGAGGMGEVHLAEHVMLKQPTAIKLIRPERAGDPDALRRFEHEVQATARLEHWNTVQIFDYGYTDDGTFYYAMEYLAGWTLEEMVTRHGPLPAGRAIHLLRQMCAALAEAHAITLIHRDIKPANIIVCARGGVHDVVKLVDFGLARSIGRHAADPGLTAAGTLLGTPSYMSPEQATGRGDLDARSDIYSVGAVAYFLVTGRPPFVHEKVIRVLMAHLQEPPVPPEQIRADVPQDLSRVILRCLQKSPADRYPSARALDTALAGCEAAGDWIEADAAAWWTTHALPDREEQPVDASLTRTIGPSTTS
jgi:serine/threonine-protein kinase